MSYISNHRVKKEIVFPACKIIFTIIDLAIKHHCVKMTAHGVNTTKTKPQTCID